MRGKCNQGALRGGGGLHKWIPSRAKSDADLSGDGEALRLERFPVGFYEVSFSNCVALGGAVYHCYKHSYGLRTKWGDGPSKNLDIRASNGKKGAKPGLGRRRPGQDPPSVAPLLPRPWQRGGPRREALRNSGGCPSHTDRCSESDKNGAFLAAGPKSPPPSPMNQHCSNARHQGQGGSVAFKGLSAPGNWRPVSFRLRPNFTRKCCSDVKCAAPTTPIDSVDPPAARHCTASQLIRRFYHLVSLWL